MLDFTTGNRTCGQCSAIVQFADFWQLLFSFFGKEIVPKREKKRKSLKLHHKIQKSSSTKKLELVKSLMRSRFVANVGSNPTCNHFCLFLADSADDYVVSLYLIRELKRQIRLPVDCFTSYSNLLRFSMVPDSRCA